MQAHARSRPLKAAAGAAAAGMSNPLRTRRAGDPSGRIHFADAGGSTAGRRNHRLEANRVDRVPPNAERVPGRLRLDHVRGELTPELGHGVLQRGRSRARRVIPPEEVDDALRRHDLAVVHQQDGENRTLTLPAQRDNVAVPSHLE